MEKDEKANQQHRRALFRAILSLNTPEECERFFADLCTPAELCALADRWRVAKLLDQEVSYREIHERTGVSTATVTRVARAMTYGESGYRTVLERIEPERIQREKVQREKVQKEPRKGKGDDDQRPG